VSVDEGKYVTDEDIETHTWHEINTQFYAFLYKQSSIADLHTLLRTLELIRTKDSLTDLEKIAVQTWISEVTIYITTHNFKDISLLVLTVNSIFEHIVFGNKKVRTIFCLNPCKKSLQTVPEYLKENKQTLQNILELLFNDKFYGLHRCRSVDLPYTIFQVLMNEKRSIVVSMGESRYVTAENIETDTWHEINTHFYAFLYKQSSIEILL
jgi:hypothetical protein